MNSGVVFCGVLFATRVSFFYICDLPSDDELEMVMSKASFRPSARRVMAPPSALRPVDTTDGSGLPATPRRGSEKGRLVAGEVGPNRILDSSHFLF